jgi:hypothetical protein
MVNPAVFFYQTLTNISFTLLGIWFAVMQFAHGAWLADEHRHRSMLHIALHFFLPGMAGLASLLSAPGDSGLVWRLSFIVAGIAGAAESVEFIRAPHGPIGVPQRTLRALDPVLYLAVVATAFVPATGFVLAPLQVGGIVNGLILLTGLFFVWLAYAERATVDQQPARPPAQPPQPGRPLQAEWARNVERRDH